MTVHRNTSIVFAEQHTLGSGHHSPAFAARVIQSRRSGFEYGTAFIDQYRGLLLIPPLLRGPVRITTILLATLAFLNAVPAHASSVCESATTDCRAKLVGYINRETVHLDIGMEEMTDSMIADAVIARFNARVPVRIIVEPRRVQFEPALAPILEKLKAAGIPMRYKAVGDIVHWKMMIFAGQNTVEFGAAQFDQKYLVPAIPLVNFAQDPTYYSTSTSIVNSFERKFDDAWVDLTTFANYSNAAAPARAYPFYSIDAQLNFVPAENFLTRAKPLYDAETTAIDVIMYKITESGHASAMIRAVQRGVPVRVITEPTLYRNKNNVWHAYYTDKMWAAGVKIRERAHDWFLHQKTALLYSQMRTIFGSSNWTAASNATQYEHNYFATDTTFFNSFKSIFDRKWNSATETRAFVPLPPDVPVYVAPLNTVSGQTTTVVLTWKPGPWAHLADVYLGTTSTPPLYLKNVSVSPNTTKKLTVTLSIGGTYYWDIVSKTMAGKTATGPIWSFGS